MKTNSFAYSDERFADLQMLRYQVNGFATLTLKQKELIFCLAKASLYGRDILWDQNGRFNLRIRKTLEAVYCSYRGDRQQPEFQKFCIYLKRIWFSNGIHHHYGCNKILPEFSEQFLKDAIDQTDSKELPLTEGQNKEELCSLLFPVIFDPSVMPKRVNQTDGEDLLITSSCNYYAPGITQAEAEAFYKAQKSPDDPHPVMYGMNSRLVKEDGKLREKVWKVNGLYDPAIRKIVYWLDRAAQVAETPQQAAVIRKLIEFYRTGDLKTFDEYTILWLQEQDALVDFTNGFTETYGDPLGLKASWEGYVNFKDLKATERTRKLSENAQWFEDHSPVDRRFKKACCQGVSAKVITAAILGGDLYPSSAIGINLPNSNWVRAEYGSKSVTIGNLTNAYNQAAVGNGFREEFVDNEETRQLLNQYADICDDLHTDLHECLGHGSGQLMPGVDPDALKAYGATIEEARADLFGLYYLADEKMVELGLTPDRKAYQAQYYSYMMNGLLTQAVRIEPGKDIEEAHMRNRALIARWTFERAEKQQAARMVRKENKTYLQIQDYGTLRKLFGELLKEIQRIKSEGDYEAARNLVETYGVKLDPTLHKEILERYSHLNLAPYKGFINPRYEAVTDENGTLTDVKIHYDEAYDAQMLRYSQEYATLPYVNE